MILFRQEMEPGGWPLTEAWSSSTPGAYPLECANREREQQGRRCLMFWCRPDRLKLAGSMRSQEARTGLCCAPRMTGSIGCGGPRAKSKVRNLNSAHQQAGMKTSPSITLRRAREVDGGLQEFADFSDHSRTAE